MATAAELRAEAARMRELARTMSDPDAVAEINKLIAEYERRAGLLDNGVASDN